MENLLIARDRLEFEQMEDELATVATFIGYFHDAATWRAAMLEVLARGAPDGNYWHDPLKGNIYTLWEHMAGA